MVVVPVAAVLVAVEAVGAEADVVVIVVVVVVVVVTAAVVVRAGPEVAAAAVIAETADPQVAVERQEYAVAVWTGNIVSSDSVV